MKKALFLDRDGVINEDFGYVFKSEKFVFKAEIFKTSKAFFDSGFLIFVITNQSGISRGYYTLQDFKKLNKFMVDEFKKNGITIQKIYFCPHTDEQHCSCRKPKPGMILQAIDEFRIDVENSFLVGDKLSDIQAGFNAKIGRLFLLSDKKVKSDIKFTQISNLSEMIKEIR